MITLIIKTTRVVFRSFTSCIVFMFIFPLLQDGILCRAFAQEDDSNADAVFDATTQIPYLTIIQKNYQVLADKGITINDLQSLRHFDIELFDENSLEEIKKEKHRQDLEAQKNLEKLREQNPQLDKEDASYEYYKETFR
ncbi:hypothetical protein JXJ21_19370, partial [candidate division KSB1 bacterium]|nr:hypothetical protein [candidate division KSB1 bacterium]